MVYAIAELISLVANVIHVLMVFSTFLHVIQVNIILITEFGLVFDVQKPNPIYRNIESTLWYFDILFICLYKRNKNGTVQLSKRSFSSGKNSFLDLKCPPKKLIVPSKDMFCTINFLRLLQFFGSIPQWPFGIHSCIYLWLFCQTR